MRLTREELDPGSFEPCERIGHGLLGARRCGRPAGSFENGKPARFARRWRARRPEQTGIARIAAGARRDLVGDLPNVLQRHAENAGRALAQAVVTSTAIERADRDLEPNTAAVTGGPNGRTDHLGAECRA